MTTKTTGRAIILHQKDNVATALEDFTAGMVIHFPERNLSVALKDEIKFGHKFAVRDIREGEKVFKYGVAIGRSSQSVFIGEHVHLHNLVTLQTKGDAE
ncbi:UxaA family hydrolase [Alicyclobacillus fastidiosus]|uniref:UxaA family hydrolase n=1 Tax=Alicyclobacillus fastidiosus TaxID=392011 RepID=A0ABY6ZNG9_9BACL|nr:UxaA family hydrolase [Alicyclobacillus fastidiosus]WAH44387.1 UxaA family hydrolase [Alicyclobacillus fastidiosus]GMA60722.1 hypothetical protein GCM10025859_11620 [Alicyclobacillus fastidiosus]